MSTRYLSNAVVALLGGAVVVLSMGLSSATAISWIAFGVAIGIVAIAAAVQLDTRRGMAQRIMDLTTVAVGGTLIAVSVVFGGTTVVWLVFALALGLIGLGFAGLTLHEVETWRARHELGQLHWLVPESAGRREVPTVGRAA